MERLLKNRKWIYIYLLVSSLILFLAAFFPSLSRNEISISTDEFGYWANAAYLSGYDWSGVSSIIPYYSFGYSLLLALGFVITNDPIILYRFSIGINSIAIVFSYLLLFSIGQKIFTGFKGTRGIALKTLCPFVIMLYPANIYLAQFSMGECVITTLFLAICLLLILYKEKKRSVFLILSYLCAVFMLSIHLRTIAVLFALFAFTVLDGIIHKKYKQVVLLCVFCSLFIIVILLVKNNFIRELYSSQGMGHLNDVSTQLNRVTNLISPRKFLEFIENLLGTSFYLGSATFLIFYFGIREIFPSRRNLHHIAEWIEIDYLKIFLLMSFSVGLLISAITIQGRTRVDLMIYGRYVENYLPIILLYGLYGILFGENNIKYLILFSFYNTVVMSVYTYVYSNEPYNNPVLFAVSSLVGYIMREDGTVLQHFEFFVNYISIGIGSIIVLLNSRKCRSDFLTILSFVLISIFWCSYTNKAFDVSKDLFCNKYSQYYNNMNLDSEKVYYVTNQGDRNSWYDYSNINFLQFLNPETKIAQADTSELQSLPDDSVIIIRSNTTIPDWRMRRLSCIEEGPFNLYIKKK